MSRTFLHLQTIAFWRQLLFKAICCVYRETALWQQVQWRTILCHHSSSKKVSKMCQIWWQICFDEIPNVTWLGGLPTACLPVRYHQIRYQTSSDFTTSPKTNFHEVNSEWIFILCLEQNFFFFLRMEATELEKLKQCKNQMTDLNSSRENWENNDCL